MSIWCPRCSGRTGRSECRRGPPIREGPRVRERRSSHPPAPTKEVLMSTTAESAIGSGLPGRRSAGEAGRAAPAHRRERGCPARSSSTTGRRACSSRRSRSSPATGRPTTTGAGRGQAECATAVHDRDRRGRHPLHPREVAARGCVAADHDARLARLGDRAARGRRPAHRPDRTRRKRRGRLPPRAAVTPRLRLLRRADRGRLERRPHRETPGRS